MRRILCMMVVVMLGGCSSAAPPSPSDVSPTSNSEQPTEGIVPTEAAMVIETPAEQPTGILPAPLYLLSEQSGSRQLWRIEADGQTVTQISDEEVAIENYDISPTTGELVYVVDQQVVKLAPDGSQRTILFENPIQDDNTYNDPHSPRWSPNGQEIMLAYGGLAVLPASGGEPEVLIPNVPQSNPDLVDGFPVETIYVPDSWSPDGQRMLISEGYVPEGSAVLVIERANPQARVTIESPRGFLCCNTSWAPDGASIVYGADRFDAVLIPGLWRADVNTGKITTYGMGDPALGPWLRASTPIALDDGTIRAFTKIANDDEWTGSGAEIELQMSTVAPDGSVTPLREDTFPVYEALWFPDQSGAVVLDQYGVEPFIAHTGEAPVTLLPILGNSMQWGR